MTTTPTSLLTIQGVTAFHLLGNSTLPLTAFPSPLCLLSSSSSSSSSSSALTLSLGSLAFPLVPGSTVFGTQEGNPAGFFLKPHIEPSKGEGEELPPSGWIKLQFPAEAVDGGQSSLSSRFEEILVKHGFLQEGVSAEEVKSLAKELSEGIKEGGHTVKEGIEQTAEQYQTSHASSAPPTHFSSRTHSAFASAASGSAAAAAYVASASDVILGYAYKAGAAVGDAVGLSGKDIEGKKEEDKGLMQKDVEGAFSFAGEAASSLGEGIAEGSSTVYHTATSAAQETIAKTQGDEAAELSAKAGMTLANVGNLAKGALLGTSVIAAGAEAGKGAASGEAAE